MRCRRLGPEQGKRQKQGGHRGGAPLQSAKFSIFGEAGDQRMNDGGSDDRIDPGAPCYSISMTISDTGEDEMAPAVPRFSRRPGGWAGRNAPLVNPDRSSRAPDRPPRSGDGCSYHVFDRVPASSSAAAAFCRAMSCATLRRPGWSSLSWTIRRNSSSSVVVGWSTVTSSPP